MRQPATRRPTSTPTLLLALVGGLSLACESMIGPPPGSGAAGSGDPGAAGSAQPVTVTQLGANYGSRDAIRFNPMGWTTQAGRTYAVAVTNIPTAINYTVQIVDCP
jgi:hypothetical protein